MSKKQKIIETRNAEKMDTFPLIIAAVTIMVAGIILYYDVIIKFFANL